MSNAAIVEDLETKERVRCYLRGRFRLQDLKPIVGDIVEYTKVLDGGVIESILKRKNELLKPRVANIDQVICVCTLKRPEVPLLVVDKLLVLVEQTGLDAVVVLNKIDLLTEEDEPKKQEFIKAYGSIYPLICTSAKTGEGLDKLKEVLKDKVSVFAGVSGVGKSTILNAICPGVSLKTQEVSEKTERGRHTTTSAELITFPFGGHVVDTPGFSLIEITHIRPEELQLYFRDFRELSEKCLFTDCTHTSEPGCKVREAVEKGILARSRYESYLEMMEEVKGKS